MRLMNTGDERLSRPSYGSWLTYGLGCENQNLPGFVTMCPACRSPILRTGEALFCPASIKARTSTRKTKAADLIANIRSPRTSPQDQRRQLDLLAALNRRHQATRRDDANLEAHIQSFKLAYRMQMEATDALDISRETKATQELYKADTVHSQQLLIARRLIERGVRVVQCYHGDVQPWDSHNNLAAEHRKLGNN